ncbi:ATP-binding protein [Telmatobacter sp. DSM 110680]|uniref:histidine kinase n=1 Tax=Telmatobacter sp. DSM 110680 TaxID=3036704 RepID=A0AAU7DLE2_9BACT
MRGLFFKIFIIFWIAQSLIFVISTAFILAHRFPRPNFLLDPALSNLNANAVEGTKRFESGGCATFNAYAHQRNETLALADASGKVLCGQALPISADLTDSAGTIHARRAGNVTVWSAPAISSSGANYLFIVVVPVHREQHAWWEDLYHFASPQLPVAIAIGGLTTFVLVLIFTRPVVRLREAALQLAQGNLSARVREPGKRSRIFKGDEFDALVDGFNHMAERLESLVNAQKLLLRDVSHELRSPLARLSVALELSREDADSTMNTHLNRIERETERLNQLIGQLLTLSSMEAAEGLDKIERVSMKMLLEEMTPDATYEAQQRDASVALDALCDFVVEGRRELLYRAIENVVRNAVRYTQPGTQVEIRLSRDNERHMVVIEVSDRGPGIPESEVASIFRPFYRVDAARSAQTGGFGVGLAIAERAIKLHNGQIRASNRAGGGTTIQISLPLSA